MHIWVTIRSFDLLISRGLIHLGRESMNTKSIPCFVMPKFEMFLKTNAPWNQLVELKNIKLVDISNGKEFENFKIESILVPHRSEYTETVGFIVKGKSKSLLFIPDIDKFEEMKGEQIEDLISRVDFALLDGTFFSNDELQTNK